MLNINTGIFDTKSFNFALLYEINLKLLFRYYRTVGFLSCKQFSKV